LLLLFQGLFQRPIVNVLHRISPTTFKWGRETP